MHAPDTAGYVHPEGCVTLVDIYGSDARVVNAARVSFSKHIDETAPLSEKDIGLIKYLAQHDHDSPFFHAGAHFRLTMPIFVAREWFRHVVGFSRNEVSRRYVDEPVQCFIPEVIRARDANVKQGSLAAPVADASMCTSVMVLSMRASQQAYRVLLAHGVAPEVARMVLPVSMMTTFVETASLKAYARLYALRNSPDAQLEIRQYAKQIGKLLENKFPVSWAALTDA